MRQDDKYIVIVTVEDSFYLQGGIIAILIVGTYLVLASCCITYMFSKVIKERLEKEKLIYTSNTDELTRCFNRRAYENDIKELRLSDEWVYISVDLNGLKRANDSYGHAAGDELICAAADCMRDSFHKYGKVYSGKTSKKEGRATLEDFLKPGAGVINSINKLDAGFNCPEASIGIILGYDSSQTKNTQRIGRLIRIFEGKSDAKIFTLVLKGTVEEKWASNKSTNVYITLDEDGLDKLLAGKQYTPKKEKQTQLTLRF